MTRHYQKLINMKMPSLFLFLSIPFAGSAQQHHADCNVAYRVCDQNRMHFVEQSGEGDLKKEAEAGCFFGGELLGNPEKNSVWLRFDIAEGGTVTFTIVPDTLTDDIDFVVFTLPLTGDCNWKRAVRCMAAGDNPDKLPNSPCMGATGLRDGETDDSEDAGCTDRSDNNWLKPLQVKEREKYVLLVSNVSSPYNGFKIRFGGTAVFDCDDAGEEKE
jgi:hypothetical protein